MTRPKDLDKLDRVKEVAIKIIVKKGYHGATIAQIAESAGVSDGYLYRYYPNKAALVESLFVENMNLFNNHIYEAIKINQTLEGVFASGFRFMAELLAQSPEVLAFIFMMDHDHNFPFPQSLKEHFLIIGEKLKNMGIKNNEINEKRTIEEILAISFGLPVKMLEMRRKGIVRNHPLDEVDIQRMTQICLNALK